MSNFISLNDYLLTKFWCTEAEQAAVNRLWWRCTAITGSGGYDTDFATQLATNMPTPTKNLINNSATYNGLQVQLYHGTLPFAAVNNTTGTGPGAGGAQAMGRQLCGMIQMQTPYAGVRYRGRVYIPFPAAAEDQNTGIPTGAYLALLNTWIAALGVTYLVGTPPNQSTLGLVIRHGPGKTVPPFPDTFVTAVKAVAKWGTQRRRGSYGKPNVSPV